MNMRSIHAKRFPQKRDPVARKKALAFLFRWQTLILVTMVFMVFEGAFRKWIFPSQQALIYFIKDGLVLLALVAFLSSRDRQFYPPSYPPIFNALLVIGALFFVLQIFNPNSPSPIVGVIGFKNYTLYILLLYMTPFLFTTADDLEAKLRKYMIIMMPVCLLGLLQYASPQNSFINVYVQHDESATMHIATFGGADNRVRASGTFSFPGGFVTFLIAMYHLALAFVLSGVSKSKSARVSQVFLVVVSLAILTTGSRTAFASTFLATPIVLLVCGAAGVKIGRLAARLGIGICLVGIAILTIGDEALDSFLFRAQNADSNVSRSFSVFTEWYGAAGQAPFLGVGIGANNPAAAAIMGARNYFDYWWLQGNFFEGEAARTTVEVGLIGFFFAFMPRFILLVVAFRITLRLRRPLFKCLSAAIFTYLLLAFFASIINNPTGGLYFWFSAGLLFAMVRIEKMEAYSPAAAAQEANRSFNSQPASAYSRWRR